MRPLCTSLQTHISCLICQNWNWIMHKGTRPVPASLSWPHGLSDHVFWCFLLPFNLNCSLHFPFFPLGQGLLSQSALQLNNQDAYAAAGYHNNQGLESVTGRSGQVGGAVHIYNQVHCVRVIMFFCFPKEPERPSFLVGIFFPILFHLPPLPFALLCLLSCSFRCPLPSFCHLCIFFFSSLLSSDLFITFPSLPTLHPPPGDIQSCGCPVSRHRLSLPGPERLICPTGPWQCVPHAYWRRTYTHWTIHVLLLCHFACTGTNPWRCRKASLVIWQMFSILSLHFWWSACQHYTLGLLWVYIVLFHTLLCDFFINMSPE